MDLGSKRETFAYNSSKIKVFVVKIIALSGVGCDVLCIPRTPAGGPRLQLGTIDTLVSKFSRLQRANVSDENSRS